MIVTGYIKKTLLKDYLNYLFQKDANDNFIVSSVHDFGKLLISRVQYSAKPISPPNRKSDDLVKFILPASRQLNNAGNYHLYYSIDDIEKLNTELSVLFNIDFDRFYLAAKKMKLQQKEIIQTFIISRKLVDLNDVNETLKKRQYRDELKQLKKYEEMLVERAYNRNDRIKLTMEQFNCLKVN